MRFFKVCFAKPVSARLLLMGFVMGSYQVLSALFFSLTAAAQDGDAGIREATSRVVGYFDTGLDLMYAIGAVVGIIGAIKVLCAKNYLAA